MTGPSNPVGSDPAVTATPWGVAAAERAQSRAQARAEAREQVERRARVDQRLLWLLQGLVAGLPWLLGGRAAMGVAVGLAVTIVLLGVVVRERRRRPEVPEAPGLGALLAFEVLILFSTIPLPPALLAVVAPGTWQIYANAIPGWPDALLAGDLARWRPLSIDVWRTGEMLARFAIGFGAYAVVVAHPWALGSRRRDARAVVLSRLVATVLATGAALSLVALVQQATDNGHILWVADEATSLSGRASGPFVNPNHLATWLEMAIPVGVALTVALARRILGVVSSEADGRRGAGMRVRRAWMTSLITQQRRLWAPLLAAGLVVLMGVALLASESRGGLAGTLIGLAALTATMLRPKRSASDAESRPGRVGEALRRQRGGLDRWGRGFAAMLVLAGVVALGFWWKTAADDALVGADLGDPSFASRLAVSAQGTEVVKDHWFLGTGLGTWLHAYRPYQAPPVEAGIWDHAHDDWLEIVAETGVVGALLLLAFAVAVMLGRRHRRRAGGESAGTLPAESAGEMGRSAAPAEFALSDSSEPRQRRSPSDFSASDWQAALADPTALRPGLIGGIIAVGVHALVEFGLRMPANLLLLMILAALLVLARELSGARTGRGASRSPGEASPGVAGSEATADSVSALSWQTASLSGLLATTVLAALPLLSNGARRTLGFEPTSPVDLTTAADLLLAEQGEAARPQAVAMVRRALDVAPSSRESLEALALVLGPDSAGDIPLRQALAQQPWASELRDQLAMRLWARGDHAAAVIEVDESLYRAPFLVSHEFLMGESGIEPRDSRDLVKALAAGDDLGVRLGSLDPELAAGVERGLRRALAETPGGDARRSIVDDLAQLLETRQRYADAAELLREEGARDPAGAAYLARAAASALAAGDRTSAEQSLLAAVVRSPEKGELYRRLVTDVYVPGGDFRSADDVLRAGRRNAVDMLPVYRATAELIERRDAAALASIGGRAAGRRTRDARGERTAARPRTLADADAEDAEM